MSWSCVASRQFGGRLHDPFPEAAGEASPQLQTDAGLRPCPLVGEGRNLLDLLVDLTSRPSSRNFSRRPSLNGKRMDIAGHHVAQCCIDRPVPRQRRLARKNGTGDLHVEMATAILGARVPGVTVALIRDNKLGGNQCRLQ